MSQATTSTQTAERVPCPRCKEPLIDPKGLGWCRACGYCRSLEETETKVVQTPKPAQAAQFPPPDPAASGSSKWIAVMFIGVALIAAATYASGRFLTMTPLERALLTTIQIGVGLVIMFIGQLIGLLRIAPEDPGLSFKDAIFPFRLYGLVFRRLPATASTVYGGSWGIAAILSAVVFIGGLGHWFSYLPGNEKNRPNQAQKMKARN